MELDIEVDGVRLPATLDLPAGPVRGAVVVLHGAQAGDRSYFCYAHLAQLLPRAGVAVLRFDRRPRRDGQDVPLTRQADDAAAAVACLRRYVGDAPIGLWGWSQGAWEVAQRVVDGVAGRAWFPLAWVPRQLAPHPGTWADMDVDPESMFAQVSCPVLLFYGATDAWVPVDASIAAWRRATAAAGTPVSVCRLAGCDHLPTLHEGEDLTSISEQYSSELLGWLNSHLGTHAVTTHRPGLRVTR